MVLDRSARDDTANPALMLSGIAQIKSTAIFSGYRRWINQSQPSADNTCLPGKIMNETEVSKHLEVFDPSHISYKDRQEVTFMPTQIGIIAAVLEDEDMVVTTNCFQVLNSLAGNFSNQKEMQKCIPLIIHFTAQSACLEQQIAGLGLISTLALCSGNHPEILKGIPEYLRILQTARYSSRVSVEPAFLHLFNPFVNKDIIYQLLAFVGNLNESLKSENSSCVQWEYNEESLYVLLFSSDSPLLNKLLPLMNHNDTRVKSAAVSIISKLV
ncbi:UNVERIFIED_CONTAM: hypothetical protein FKN15_000845 [Acipenser sinensis]